jgi:hypothetical protein
MVDSYEEAVVDNQALRDFKPDVAIVHTTSRNIRHFPEAGEDQTRVEDKFNLEIGRFRSVWDALLSEFGCLVIQNNFDPCLSAFQRVTYYEILNALKFITEWLAMRELRRSEQRGKRGAGSTVRITSNICEAVQFVRAPR